MTVPVVVVGGGGHAKVVIDSLRAGGREVAGFTDSRAHADPIAGAPHLGSDAYLDSLPRTACEVVVALGDNRLRARLIQQARDRGFSLANAIHPTAWISPSVELGSGIAIMANAVVNASSRVGDGAIVNTGATVDHDCEIGAFAHLAPGTHLSGYIAVGEGALVGVGSAVGIGRPLRVGEWAIIGTGSVVVRQVAAGSVVAGNPARTLRKASEGGPGHE